MPLGTDTEIGVFVVGTIGGTQEADLVDDRFVD